MKKKRGKGSVRLPMPPPGKPQGTKKGDKGYVRAKERDRARRTGIE